MQVFLSPQADQDLDEMYVWVGAESPKAADQLLDDIISFCFEELPENPEMGRSYNEQLRMFVKRGYRIFYRVGVERLDVVRVLHTARDSDAIMR